LHILDIAQNGIEAGATALEIDLLEDPAADLLTIEVRDNGRGMSREACERALDPFFTTRTTRRVGMGLPLLAAAARASGGSLTLDSQPGAGTGVRATFHLGHIDRPPLGDLQTTLLVLMAGSPSADIRFRHTVGDRGYELRSSDLRAALEGGSLAGPEGVALVREAIRRGERALG
ncbi:MAG: ATP-binding protein, partial [Acidobacteriota bacterium]